jgi:hypothetical protein
MKEIFQRVQLSRKKGWRMPTNTVKVDRTTQWGNVVKVGSEASVEGIDGNRYTVTVTPAIAVAIHRQVVEDGLKRNPGHLDDLRGKNLACWCRLGEPCHAGTLLELANR